MNETNLNYRFYFDLDGTISGNNEWVGFFYNTIKLFDGKKIFKPKVGWSILTSRPKIDKIIVKTFCKIYKLYPIEIITADTWFYNFENKEEISMWKSHELFKAIENNPFIDKFVYVDNDIEIRSKIYAHPKLITCTTQNVNYIVKEFINGK